MPRKTNFTANGSNYYRVTATVGKNADGTPIRKQFYGVSKKEAQEKKAEYMAALKDGLSVDYDKATFGVAFKHWLENVKRHAITVTTYDKYSRLHRLYIVGCELAGMRLVDVKAANIQAYYNTLIESTTANNIHEINKLLKTFFGYCIKNNSLVRSPLLAVELPKTPTQPERNTALSDTDIKKLVQACKEDMKHFPFLFLCFSGLREGELLALTFKDLDFKTGMINVNKAVKQLTIDGEYQTIVSEPKTAASVRSVPILEEIKPMLIEHISRVRQSHNVISMSGDFLLFPSDTGTYRDRTNLLKAFKRLCVKLEIDKGCTVHSLRHTYCSILARKGVSLLEASRLMGHADINTTAKVYSHVSDDDKKNAVQKLAAYFN